MQQAGAYVKEEVCRALIVLISNAPELHGYTARSMYRALKDSAHQAELTLSLVTSTCWFLGELVHPCLSFKMIVGAAGQVQICKLQTGAILHPIANSSCIHSAKTALMSSVQRVSNSSCSSMSHTLCARASAKLIVQVSTCAQLQPMT